MKRVLLFDLDGTLTEDHEGHFAAARDAAFEEIGHPLNSALSQRARAENIYIATLAEMVVPGLTTHMHEELVRALYAATNRRYDVHLATHAAWRRGAQDMLAKLETGHNGIVTGAWPNNIRAMCQRLRELEGIAVIITSKDTHPRQKPDPHGLALAAEKMGVQLGTCAYVGDHWKDMEAARRARIPGILLRTETTTMEALCIATHVIDDLRELLTIDID